MSEILFLAPRVPFPPDRGDKIRSHHLLKALANLAPVHVGCFAENAGDHASQADLAGIAASYCMPKRRMSLPLAGLDALIRHEPISLAAFRSRELASWVRQVLEHRPIDTIYVFSGQMGRYVPSDWAGRLVVDLVDVDSAKYEAYAATTAFPMRSVHAREARLLRGEEARLAAKADLTLLVSEPEAKLLMSRLPSHAVESVKVLGNGIDGRAFDPTRTAAHPELKGGGPHFVLTGQMDYAPNVEGAIRVVHRLMPRLLSSHPEAQFHVVGRDPGRDLIALEGVNRTRIWGEVADVRPFLAAADLVLVPLTIARGVQNKVLEAMAMARPVVLTRAAATGIPGEDRAHFAVGDTDDDLVARALDLLADRPMAREMGASARKLMIERMSWPAMMAPLPAIVDLPRERRDAA